MCSGSGCLVVNSSTCKAHAENQNVVFSEIIDGKRQKLQSNVKYMRTQYEAAMKGKGREFRPTARWMKLSFSKLDLSLIETPQSSSLRQD